MSQTTMSFIQGPVVEDQVQFTLVELCQACHAEPQHVTAWVVEGVLQPVGQSPQEWRFGGESLRRARLALTLSRDLEINAAGVHLLLDLLAETAALRARLQRLGAG